MSKQSKKIDIEVILDKDNVPEDIIWQATDLEGYDKASCRAMILSLWDHTNKDTLRLDLWTKDMTVDEMKIFFHQTLVTMADTLENSTNDPRISGDMRDFCDYFAERWKSVNPENMRIDCRIVVILSMIATEKMRIRF